MKSKEEFEQYVASKINSTDINNYKKYNKLTRTFTWICLPLIVASFGLCMSQQLWIYGYGLFVITFTLFIISRIFDVKRHNISGAQRDDFINYALGDYPHTFDSRAFIAKSIFRQSQFVGRMTSFQYRGSDMLIIPLSSNSKKSTSELTICDVDATEQYTDNEGNVHEQTIYHGVFGYIDFPTPFKCTLSINSSYVGSFKSEKVSLEDINFNKDFSVKCSDQLEARYILTTDMMLYLSQLREKMGKIKLVLDGNRMYIGFPNYNLFNTRSKEKEGLLGDVYGYYQDICTLMEFINTIRSNDKIFTID